MTNNKSEIDSLTLNYKIFKWGIEIYDSYQVTDTQNMKKLLKHIMNQEAYKECGFTRKINSYIAEWKFHNFCYKIHFMRDRAKDVFLDKEFPRTLRGIVESCIYKVLSIFY